MRPLRLEVPWPYVAAAIVGLVGLHQRSWFLFGLALMAGLATGVTRLWGRYALYRLTYERTLDRDRCFPGEELRLVVTVTNRKPLPVTFLTVEELVPDAIAVGAHRLIFARPGKGLLRILFGLGWYEQVERTYRITPGRRGFFRLGPAQVTGGDPFGFLLQRETVAGMLPLIVYPHVAPLERFGIPSHRPFGDLRSRSRLFADPMCVNGTRDYEAGDPLNRIHWAATAALGRIQVKTLASSSQPGIALFLNTWSFSRRWEGADSETLDLACTVSASIANWASERSIPVGLYANGFVTEWGASLRLRPEAGGRALLRTLEGLARLDTAGLEPITQLLGEELPRIGYGTTVVLLTRLLSPELQERLYLIARSGRPVVLILLGHAEGDMPVLPSSVIVYRVVGEEEIDAGLVS